jgi:hypothetical protein
MKKAALIHLTQDTTVTRMKHHKPVAKVIATAACGAGTHVKRSTDEMVVTCQACPPPLLTSCRTLYNLPELCGFPFSRTVRSL